MTALLAALGLWVAGALGAALAPRRASGAWLGTGGAVAGGVAAAFAAVPVLMGSPATGIEAGWSVPWAALALRLDALSAVFLLPVAVVGAASAVFGAGYLSGHGRHAAGASLIAFDLLLASMALVVTASNLVLLLVAWEVMTLASCALLASDHERAEVRAATLSYLIAAHLASAALVVFAVLLAGDAGRWDMATGVLHGTAPAAAMVALAIAGFGTKAGLVPFHVWLPEAHAAAPGHVSALMSGVMVTMGFYGLARFLPGLAPGSAAPGWVMLILGAAGAVAGIGLSLVQRDVKRALAYSTVENAGLIALAMGAGMLGTARGQPRLAALAWTAALLHLWNHAIFKALMFQGAAATAKAMGGQDLERWGGVLARWPRVGGLMILGAAALAAVPGLNGFAGEWAMMRALLEGGLALRGAARVGMMLGLLALAYAASLALAGAARLAGIGLLGQPRSLRAAEPREPGGPMLAAMAVLGLLCLMAGLFPAALARALSFALPQVAPGADAGAAFLALAPIGPLSAVVIGTVAVAALARAAWLGRRPVRRSSTWGCGYALPSPRFQSSASSFAEPVTHALSPLLGATVESDGPRGLWPAVASWRSHSADLALERLYRPAFQAVAGLMMRVRDMQESRVTVYLRFVALALLVLLALLFLPLGARP